MKVRVLTTILTVLACALPAAGQDVEPDEGSVLIRINGDITTTAEEENDAVIVVNGEGRISGASNVVVVLNGGVLLSGARVDELIVINGQARLTEGTVIFGDVHLLNGDVFFEGGSAIQGTIKRDDTYRFGRGLLILGIIFGLGYGIAVVLGGVAAAAIAPEGVRRSGAALLDNPGGVLVAALLLWVVLPLVAVALLFTVVGIPLGLAILIFLLPAVAFLGYIIAGIRLGDAVVRWIRGSLESRHPYLAAVAGLTLLALLGLLPVLGSIITFVATLGGSGALALVLWRMIRQRDIERAVLAS